ncbi:MAG: hypothetical protein EOO38_04235 [Cytophagaceae bacterium]|jgi:hypothetical protein|nr:MAG: hypothetical protein EOO38_04235 [Cytophagaceae bacterium]
MKDAEIRRPILLMPAPTPFVLKRVSMSEGQRESIRQEIALGWLTRAAAAKQYGVSRTMINAIVNKVGRVNGGVARPRRKAVAD